MAEEQTSSQVELREKILSAASYQGITEELYMNLSRLLRARKEAAIGYNRSGSQTMLRMYDYSNNEIKKLLGL